MQLNSSTGSCLQLNWSTGRFCPTFDHIAWCCPCRPHDVTIPPKPGEILSSRFGWAVAGSDVNSMLVQSWLVHVQTSLWSHVHSDWCLPLAWLSLGLFLVGFGWHLGFLCLYASVLSCFCLVVVFPVGGWAVCALSPIGFCSLAWLRALAGCWAPCVLQLAVAWWFFLGLFPSRALWVPVGCLGYRLLGLCSLLLGCDGSGLAPHLLRALFAEGQFTFKVLYIYIYIYMLFCTKVVYGSFFPRPQKKVVKLSLFGGGRLFNLWNKAVKCDCRAAGGRTQRRSRSSLPPDPRRRAVLVD